jgi:hypothetical protein
MIRRHSQSESETIYHAEALCSAIAASVSPQATQQAGPLDQRLTLDDVINQALG